MTHGASGCSLAAAAAAAESARDRRVTRTLERHGLATLLLDLLTADEADAVDASFRFDIPLKAVLAPRRRSDAYRSRRVHWRSAATAGGPLTREVRAAGASRPVMRSEDNLPFA
jgi:hypothetical protein